MAIGKLYPVLVDKRGIVIDGEHRLRADPTWFRVEVSSVESEEQRLLARLVSNVCRRSLSFEEKTEMLSNLGQVYLKQGVCRSELIKTLVKKTGLSYRWVMKYIPDQLKLRPGLGGRRSRKKELGYEVARRATAEESLFLEPRERVVRLASYSNTNFATMLVEKQFYLKLKQAATDLGIDATLVINNALLLAFQSVNHLRSAKKLPPFSVRRDENPSLKQTIEQFA